jgi:hypothetical protein
VVHSINTWTKYENMLAYKQHTFFQNTLSITVRESLLTLSGPFLSVSYGSTIADMSAFTVVMSVLPVECHSIIKFFVLNKMEKNH